MRRDKRDPNSGEAVTWMIFKLSSEMIVPDAELRLPSARATSKIRALPVATHYQDRWARSLWEYMNHFDRTSMTGKSKPGTKRKK